jgi:gliding motility-associated lipoprotein GldH
MINQKNNFHFFLGFSLFILFSACNKENTLVDKYIEIPNGNWADDNIVTIEFDVADTTIKNNFYITLRNTEDYKYSNLYLFVTTMFPNEKTSSDTIGVALADPSGKWLGKGGGFVFDNEIIDNRILYNYQKKFPLAGHYKITLLQAMREKELIGIIDAGIRIEEAH